ncbi:10757_t:CDS:2, partial [Ambispora leptoticha]
MSDRINQFTAYLSLIQSQVSKLQQDLNLKEDYILYLEKEILIRDEELDPLRTEISNLKEDLKKALQRSESQENYIGYLEKQQYFQSPLTIAPTINGIVDNLNIIFDAGNRFEGLVLQIYPQVNARAIYLENQIANLRTQLGALQNDYDLLNQAYRAHKLNHHLLKATCIDKKKRISELLQEKFALRLVNKWTQKLLQDCRTKNQSQYKKALDHLDFIAQRLEYPDDASRDPDALDNFIEKELYNRLGYMNFNIQSKKLYATKKPTKTKKKTVTRYCSMCGKAGHTKTNCPKVCRAGHSVSKKAKQINNISQYGYISQSQSKDEIEYDQEETSQTESDQENSEIESQETNCFNLKKKIFLESVKYIITRYIPQCPKEVLTEIYTDLSKLFPEMKDSYYSYHLKNYTKKEVDKVWENIIKKYQVILEPLFQACSSSSHELEKVEGSSSLNYAIKQYQEAQLYRNWFDPLKINFLQIKEPNNYATILCKVYDLEILHALLDTGSDGSHISENITNHFIKYFGLKLDRKKIYRLTGAVGKKQSIGSFSDIPVTIGIEKDTLIISDEFSVLPTEKDNN